MADGHELRPGEKVTWRAHGTTTEGTVDRELTSRTQAAGRTLAATEDDPRYVATSDRSGREAVHKPASTTSSEEN